MAPDEIRAHSPVGRFDPERILGVGELDPFELIPQGGGDPASGHRCPGEDLRIALLCALVSRLAALDFTVPEQDLSIPLSRIPTRPVSGVMLADVSS